MATAAATTGVRTPRYMKIKAGKFIELQLKDSAYNAGLKGKLGIQDTAPSDAAQIVGSGREDALQNGAVPVVLTYKVTDTKTQSAKVLCSPEMADTIFSEGVGQTYRGKRITKVRFPRRRVYTF